MLSPSNSHPSRHRTPCPDTPHYAYTITPPSSPPPKSPLPPLPSNPPSEAVAKPVLSEYSSQSNGDRRPPALSRVHHGFRNTSSRSRAVKRRHQRPRANRLPRYSETDDLPNVLELSYPCPAIYTPISNFQLTEDLLTALPTQHPSSLVENHRRKPDNTKTDTIHRECRSFKPYLCALQPGNLMRAKSNDTAHGQSAKASFNLFQSSRAYNVSSTYPHSLVSCLKLKSACPSCLQRLFQSLQQSSRSSTTSLEWLTFATHSHSDSPLGHMLHNAGVRTAGRKERIQPCTDRIDFSDSRPVPVAKLQVMNLKNTPRAKSSCMEQKPSSVRITQPGNARDSEPEKPRLILNTTDGVKYTSATLIGSSHPISRNTTNKSASYIHAHASLDHSPDFANISPDGVPSPNDSHKALFGKDLEADESCEKSIFKSRKSKIVLAFITTLLVLLATAGILGGLIWKLDHMTDET